MERANCVWPGSRSRRFPAFWAAPISPRLLARSSIATVGRLAEQHLERSIRHRWRPHPRIVDKMPDNYMYLGLLSILFPNAVFVHSRRDLRDVAVSCWMTDFRSIRWANDRSTSPRGSSSTTA